MRPIAIHNHYHTDSDQSKGHQAAYDGQRALRLRRFENDVEDIRYAEFCSIHIRNSEEEKRKDFYYPNSEPSSAHFYQMYQSHM
jgi:hypothetical protein